MELRGELHDINSLLEAFHIVALGQKTGEMTIVEEGRITLFLKDGFVVNLETTVPLLRNLSEKLYNKEIPLAEAIKSFLHYIYFSKGESFSFKDELPPIEELGRENIINLSMEFTKEVDELSPLLKKYIEENPHFTLSSDTSSNNLTLERRDLWIIQSFMMGNTLREVLFADVPFFDIANRITKLLQYHVLIPATGNSYTIVPSNRPKFVSEKDMEQVKSIMTHGLGPIGALLVEETLEELGVNELPYDMREQFMELLLEKIPPGCVVDGEECRNKMETHLAMILRKDN